MASRKKIQQSTAICFIGAVGKRAKYLGGGLILEAGIHTTPTHNTEDGGMISVEGGRFISYSHPTEVYIIGVGVYVGNKYYCVKDGELKVETH